MSTSIIANVYNEILKSYRSMIPPCTSTAERKWFIDEYPVLNRGIQWNRALYDMNVNSWNLPHLTGICLPTALFVQAYLKDIHNIESEIIGLFDMNTFCHCVLNIDDKYHDVFWPEGTTEKPKLMYGDVCHFGDVSRITKLFKNNSNAYLIMEDFFDKIKSNFYQEDSSTEKFYENLVDTTLISA